MIFCNSFRNDKSLNSICKQAVMSKRFRIRLYESIKSDWNYLENTCINTIVSIAWLNLLYILSFIDVAAKEIFCQTIDLAESQTFTNRILNRILKHPDMIVRNRCIVSLSHKELSKECLFTLCHTGLCFECYFSLVILLYTEKSATVAELNNALSAFRNSQFVSMQEELWDELKCKNASCIEKYYLVFGK